MLTMRRFAAVSLIILNGLGLSACSTNPATGERIFTGMMSPEQEQSIGDQGHNDYIKEFGGINDNAKLNEFVARIGAKLVPFTERQDVPNYTFTVVNTDDVNAFAVPGGYIYMTRGLLNLAQNEAQVAGVLAHELAHIQARHSAQQYSKGMLANLGVGVLGAAVGGNSGQMLSQVAGVGAQAGLMKYSRDHEYEADMLGIHYMQKAGYDPNEAARFLQMLDRNSQFENRIANKEGGNSKLADFMASHPSTPERVNRAFAIAAQAPQGNYTVGRDSYLKAIDGTNYGGSSSSGFVRGNDYVHPQMGFKFTVPDGFNIDNGAKQVVAENGRGALIVFDMGKGLTNAPGQYMAQSWLQNQPVGNAENISINGLDAATGTASVNTSAGSKDGRFVAISAERGEFYRLAFLTPVGQQGSYADDFRRTTYSFKMLSQKDKEQLSPSRVRLMSVKAGDTVASMAQKMSVADNAVDRFCLLNGVTPETALSAGQLVKVVQPY